MAAFYGIALADGTSGTGARTGVDEDRLRAAVDVMRPKPSPYPLLRIGGDADGSYLLPDDIAGIEACFSPGVNNFKFFEDYLADHYGIASHMCDKSSDIEKFRTPMKPGLQTFIKKWLDVDGGEDSVALADWVAAHCPGTGDLLLQIDIEGAEYRNLLATPPEVLRRFRIIVIEVHGLIRLTDPAIFDTVLAPFLTLLDQDFICVHAHPNNCCGDITLPGIGVNIPRVHELTFLRRDRFTAPGAGPLIAPVLPHPLDVGRNARSNPPLFLNEAWFDGPRPDSARHKMLEDQLAYQGFARKTETAEHRAALKATYQIAQRLHRQTVSLGSKTGAHVDIAEGKPFVLSSNHPGTPLTGTVIAAKPFFFHTRIEPRPFITIDLQAEQSVQQIVIRNRTNGQGHRADFLFATVHSRPDDRFAEAFPLNVDAAFLGAEAPECITDTDGQTGQYVTIFSMTRTALHLSAIRVLSE
jgi:hypothetical protein